MTLGSGPSPNLGVEERKDDEYDPSSHGGERWPKPLVQVHHEGEHGGHPHQRLEVRDAQIPARQGWGSNHHDAQATK